MHGIKGVSMTNTSTLTLDGVSFQLPDGSLLFSDLDETFDTRHTGLVGRNGVGKSLLARLLAGHLQPSSGSVRRQGRVRYLAQQLEPADYPTVADLAGVRPWLEALARIEAGSLDAADYECLGERWDIRQRLADALAAEGLGHLRADTPSERLSGGECMRVALLGAFLDDADFLILDEPSNPLDGPARALLRARLAAWDGGLLLVSHDRELLEGMQRIVELSTLGLRSYGGGYSFTRRAGRRHARPPSAAWTSVVWSASGRPWPCANSSSARSGARPAAGAKARRRTRRRSCSVGSGNVARSAPASCATPTRRSASVSTARCARLPGR